MTAVLGGLRSRRHPDNFKTLTTTKKKDPGKAEAGSGGGGAVVFLFALIVLGRVEGATADTE